MIRVIDDQQLSATLRGAAQPVPAKLYTTGCWYVRLCQAVLGATDRGRGVHSTPFAALPADARAKAIEALLELPEEIGLVSLRDLAPLIGRLRRRHQLNILGMEALAAAIDLDATVVLSAPSPRLQQALELEGRDCQIITH